MAHTPKRKDWLRGLVFLKDLALQLILFGLTFAGFVMLVQIMKLPTQWDNKTVFKIVLVPGFLTIWVRVVVASLGWLGEEKRGRGWAPLFYRISEAIFLMFVILACLSLFLK